VLGLDGNAPGRPRTAAVTEVIAAIAPGTRTSTTSPHLVVQVGADQPASLAAATFGRRGLAVLAVEIRDGIPVVGPFVEANGRPCLGCLDQHRIDRDPDWPQIAAALATGPPAEEACDLVTIMSATALATFEALTHIDGGTPETVGAALEVVAPGSVRRRDWPRHPRCSCTRTKL
jgi:hypothetical protein